MHERAVIRIVSGTDVHSQSLVYNRKCAKERKSKAAQEGVPHPRAQYQPPLSSADFPLPIIHTDSDPRS